MTKRFLAVVLALAFAPVLHAGDIELGESDQAAIRIAATDYAEGWYSGDRERMQRALHERLAKRAYLREKGSRERRLNELDKAGLLAGNRPENAQHYAKAPKRAEVEILDGFGNVATVKLRMDGWVDYMHLVRGDDKEWRIINVLWEPLSP